MQTNGAGLLLVAALVHGATACQCDCDSVAPSYYGQGGNGVMLSSQSRVSSAASTHAEPADTAGDLNAAAPRSALGTQGATAGASGAPVDAVPNAVQPSAANGGMSATMGSAPSAGVSGECDMSGRWLVTQHLVSDALGSLQYGHYFYYYEIDQEAAVLTVTKGLLCGYDSIGSGDFAATADFRAAWASTVSKVNLAGQTGTSTPQAAGCKVDFQKWYTVRGATVAYYKDPAKPLPSVFEQATDSSPGWEDWDGDGNPGITGVVSGIVSGKIFVAPRMWTAMSGTVRDVSATFTLPTQWNQEPNVMSFDGTPLLGSEAARAADAKLHFAQFARLSKDQATGDDAAICTSVVALAAKLCPEAAGM